MSSNHHPAASFQTSFRSTGRRQEGGFGWEDLRTLWDGAACRGTREGDGVAMEWGAPMFQKCACVCLKRRNAPPKLMTMLNRKIFDKPWEVGVPNYQTNLIYK